MGLFFMLNFLSRAVLNLALNLFLCSKYFLDLGLDLGLVNLVFLCLIFLPRFPSLVTYSLLPGLFTILSEYQSLVGQFNDSVIHQSKPPDILKITKLRILFSHLSGVSFSLIENSCDVLALNALAGKWLVSKDVSFSILLTLFCPKRSLIPLYLINCLPILLQWGHMCKLGWLNNSTIEAQRSQTRSNAKTFEEFIPPQSSLL